MPDWATVGTSLLASSVLASVVGVSSSLLLARRQEQHQRELAANSREHDLALKRLEYAQLVQDERRTRLRSNLTVVMGAALGLQKAGLVMLHTFPYSWHDFQETVATAMQPVREILPQIALDTQADRLIELLFAAEAQCIGLLDIVKDRFAVQLQNVFLEAKQEATDTDEVATRSQAVGKALASLDDTLAQVLAEARRILDELDRPADQHSQ